MYFGSYPQTEIVANPSQCGTTGKHFAESSDYEVNANLYGRLKTATYDANGNTIIDGVKYKKLTRENSSFIYFTVFDTQRPDYYDYDQTGETAHYFRYDKIKWRVLENKDGYALLLSDIILDNLIWHNGRDELVLWNGCLTRAWLNGNHTVQFDYRSNNFKDSAFNSTELAAIKKASIANEANIVHNEYGAEPTEDYVFLLSESDVWHTDKCVSYGFVKDAEQKAPQRLAKSSTFAKAMGLYISSDSNNYSRWWTRSPGYDTFDSGCKAIEVTYKGNLWAPDPNLTDPEAYKGLGRTQSTVAGIRPAIYMNVSSSAYSPAGTVSSDGSASPNTPVTPTEPEALKTANVKLSKTSFTYTGKELKPDVTVKNVNGTTLEQGTDYTLSYSSGRKNVGSYTVTVTGKDGYSGTIKQTYSIIPKGTSISKVTPGNKYMTVKWSKQSSKMSTSTITGYQVVYALDSKFTKSKKTVNIKGYSSTSKKIKSLKSKKKYYVKIRTYKTVSGKTYYSSWSKVKTTTVK